jgi:hypothetical protein
MDTPDHLVELTSVATALEGKMLVDLLLSGGIAAMLRDGAVSGYGGISINPSGGAGSVMVYQRDLADAREFVQKWNVPLLKESDAPTNPE